MLSLLLAEHESVCMSHPGGDSCEAQLVIGSRLQWGQLRAAASAAVLRRLATGHRATRPDHEVYREFMSIDIMRQRTHAFALC